MTVLANKFSKVDKDDTGEMTDDSEHDDDNESRDSDNDDPEQHAPGFRRAPAARNEYPAITG